MDQQVENKRESRITNEALANFTGTDGYYRHIPGTNCLGTDGAKFLTENGASWLIDVVFSYQHLPLMKTEPFQVWTLEVEGTTGKVTADDGNGVVLITQDIPYTDFPLSKIKLYCCEQEEYRVVMLPSEY